MFIFLLWITVEAITFHIVPSIHTEAHFNSTLPTHDDEAATQAITSVLEILSENVQRKFVLTDLLVLKRFLDLHPKTRSKIISLISEGRLEVINGQRISQKSQLMDFEAKIRQIHAARSFFHNYLDGLETHVAFDEADGLSSVMPAIFSRFGYEFLVVAGVRKDFQVRVK